MEQGTGRIPEGKWQTHTGYSHFSVIFVLQWLRKQAEARKPVDIDDPDLTEEEKNPQWLKEKGE